MSDSPVPSLATRPALPEPRSHRPGNFWSRLPLALKLTLLVGFTVGVLLAVIVVASGLVWRDALRQSLDDHLRAVAVSRRDMVRAQIMLLRQRVELSTDRGELRGFLYGLSQGNPTEENRQGSQDALVRLTREKPIVAASLADLNGRILLSTVEGEVGRTALLHGEFKSGLKETFIAMPRLENGGFRVTVASPVRTRADKNRVYGTLITTADFTDFAKALQDDTGLGHTGDVILAMRAGDTLRFVFPPRLTPSTREVAMSAEPALAASAQGREILWKGVDYRGVPVVAASQPIGLSGLSLVVKQDAREAYLPITRLLGLEVVAGGVAILAGLVAAYFVARSFTRPVRDLAAAAKRITAGDYTTRLPVESNDEFGLLTRRFNEMTAAIDIRRVERDQAADALRDADRRKDEFLAMLGHELRNPLSAIANAVTLWNLAGTDSAAIGLAREVIERQTANLSRMVDDLLDVARITAGKIDLRTAPVDFHESVRRAIEAARPFANERRHEWKIDLAADEPLTVEADSTRIEQVVTNLLTNAIKYTRKGGTIRVNTFVEHGDAVLQITDNGIGIAPRMLPHIFEIFAQGDRSLDRSTGGLGIGLYLCRRLVELHGGAISASSEGVGRGATFTIRLPVLPMVAPVMLPQPPSEPSATHRHKRILLVDDNQDSVHSLARLLSMRGHEVVTAFDGVAALKIAQEFQPDILLLDIGLPGLDGYEVARRLRANGFIHTQIVAISGYAQENDRIRSREAGFNYHFAKPVDFDALAELIVEEPLNRD